MAGAGGHIDAGHHGRRFGLGQRPFLGHGAQHYRHPRGAGGAVQVVRPGHRRVRVRPVQRAHRTARSITMPWLADLDHKVIWPDFAAHWGNAGPAGTIESFQTMGPFPIPTINTALLLLSGVTLTISHHALRAGHRTQTAIWLFATILLGAIFMGFQAYEYHHAYSELNLKLTSGVYGSTFFMLTGFHGFHVTMGAIMLSVVLYRLLR